MRDPRHNGINDSIADENYAEAVRGERTALKPDTLEEWREKTHQLIDLLIECRDALPAISVVSARLHNVDLSLADRIEAALKPWELK